MTMLFTQQLAAVHAFDHNNACNRGSAAFLPTSTKKPVPQSMADSPAALVMPCPKKAAVLCSNAFLGTTNPVVAVASSRWESLSLVDDTHDIQQPLFLVGNDDQDHYFDQAACAELMEIMSSSGSSRSSSSSSSPQPSLNGDVESLPPAESTFPLGLFEEYATFFGSSPIVRANNPLPNDESFHPSHPEPANEVAENFQSFLTRHRHQAKVFDFNLNVDEDGERQIPSRANVNPIGAMF